MTQIGLGILVGSFLAIGISGGNGVGLVLMYGSVILAISSLATLGPVQRPQNPANRGVAGRVMTLTVPPGSPNESQHD